ncbi:MAG TPA: TlpA disulfide reductase family protein, partial [Opitutaceae bacterium]|nr:TlpA disulfide reductase family protein [Opitutaceae bacterium]
MLRIILLCAAAAAVGPRTALADEKPASAIEQQISEATSSPRVTVVHFWAPWCPNCRAELAGGAWSGFIAGNPDVNVVFVTIWNPADGREVLEKFGVGSERNFRLLLHPNGSRRRGEKVSELLGMPISWIPTTWIFRDGRLRYALNYGELRFPVLQQLVKDSSDSWD